MAVHPFELPDTTAALPRLPFEFSAAAAREAAEILAQPPEVLFGRLLRDQESEAVMLAARRVIGAFLSQHGPSQHGPGWPGPGREASAEDIGEHVAQVRAELEAAAPRVACPEHGVVVAAVPWARHGAAPPVLR